MEFLKLVHFFPYLFLQRAFLQRKKKGGWLLLPLLHYIASTLKIWPRMEPSAKEGGYLV